VIQRFRFALRRANLHGFTAKISQTVEATVKNESLSPARGRVSSLGVRRFRSVKKRKGRQNFKSAASITLMSMLPDPPERLAEVLLEILALADSTRTGQSESARGSDSIESFDAHRVEEQSRRTDQEDNDQQRA